jgi:hypothetical protein
VQLVAFAGLANTNWTFEISLFRVDIVDEVEEDMKSIKENSKFVQTIAFVQVQNAKKLIIFQSQSPGCNAQKARIARFRRSVIRRSGNRGAYGRYH